MTTLHNATALAAAALLALTLAGCSSAADTSSGTGTDDTGTGDTSQDDTSTDDTAGGSMVTLSGSGEYTVGVDAPYGGYQFAEETSQPAGCTWSVSDENGTVQFENQGITVFLTEVNKTFTTSGCPDWVQFE